MQDTDAVIQHESLPGAPRQIAETWARTRIKMGELGLGWCLSARRRDDRRPTRDEGCTATG
jgi:hypothetical protein